VFRTAVVVPHIQAPTFLRLGRWSLNVRYEDVTMEWVETLSAFWFKGEPVTVSFWYRRQWCTGQAYVHSVSPDITWGDKLAVSMALMGTKELKKGSIWL
jgi:hypothetical protein